MGIGQLAERLEVSEATISRFARHAGYRDFKHLKQSVMQQSREKGPARKIARTLQKEEVFRLQNGWNIRKNVWRKPLRRWIQNFSNRSQGDRPGEQGFYFFEKRVGRNGRTFVFPAAQNRDSG